MRRDVDDAMRRGRKRRIGVKPAGRVALTRVVLLGLDGFPARAISPGLTPHLWALAGAGGRAPEGGLAPLPSSTYPGFASLLTGVEPAQHGVLTTTRQEGAVPGWAGATRVAAPTLFERCEAAGLRTAAVLGDHLLYGVLRAEAASHAWPPAGQPGGGIPRDAHGYPVNSEVRPHLLATAPDPRFDFVFAHLNEADTLGHDLGPDHPETVRCYAATDAIAGALIAALAPRWDETVVVIVSDHDMEPRSPNPPVDLAATPGLVGLVLDTVFDGGAAWVLARPGAAGRVREIVEGLAGIDACLVDGDRLLAVTRPGWRFAPVRSASGYHGGAGAIATVAVVGGGHPAVRAVAGSIATRRPRLIDWAPTILDLLDVSHEGLAGASLMAVAT